MTRQVTQSSNMQKAVMLHPVPKWTFQAKFRFPYTESELLADLTLETARADELAKITVSEFGETLELFFGDASTEEIQERLHDDVYVPVHSHKEI